MILGPWPICTSCAVTVMVSDRVWGAGCAWSGTNCWGDCNCCWLGEVSCWCNSCDRTGGCCCWLFSSCSCIGGCGCCCWSCCWACWVVEEGWVGCWASDLIWLGLVISRTLNTKARSFQHWRQTLKKRLSRTNCEQTILEWKCLSGGLIYMNEYWIVFIAERDYGGMHVMNSNFSIRYTYMTLSRGSHFKWEITIAELCYLPVSHQAWPAWLVH